MHAEGSLEAEDVFVGRDGAFYVLERAARLQRVIVVHGPGGTGKTELAKAFARWWSASGGLEREDLVFFYSFEPSLPSFGLDGIVNAIGLRLFGPDFIGRTENAEHRRALILEVLRGHRILLIWDNFETVRELPDKTGATPPLDDAQCNEIRAFLDALAGPGGNSALIVTSRAKEDWLGGVRRIELGGLKPQEAAEYADRLLAPYPTAQSRRQSQAFADLLDTLEGHPLSLRLMLPQLETTDVGKLLAALRGDAPLPEAFDDSEHRTKSLAASVKYSLDHLAEPIRSALPVLSLLEGVADVVVLGLFSAEEGVPERFARRSAEEWKDTLAATARVGLLTELGSSMHRLHPALPAYLNAQWRADAGAAFEGERSAADVALLRAYADLGSWLQQQITAGSAEFALAMIELQRRTMGRLIALGLDQEHYYLVGQVLQPLTKYWNSRGLRDEAQGWTDRIRDKLERDDGTAPEFDTDAGALWLFLAGEQAIRALEAGDSGGAEQVYEEIRVSLELAPKSDRRDGRLAVTYHQLGAVAQDRGDLTAAENWYRKSLVINEALGDQRGTALNYHQLGMVAQDRGDLTEAENWYRKFLVINEALGDQPGMALNYHQLGMVAQGRGDLTAAEDWCRKSLKIKEALGDRPGMATSYHQLGMVAQGRGDLTAAEGWYLKSLEIKEALGDRPSAAAIYHQLGMVAQHRGDLPAAEGWYRRSLEIDEAHGDRPGMAMTYGQLGLLAEALDNAEAALDWTVRCVLLFDEFPHPLTGSPPITWLG